MIRKLLLHSIFLVAVALSAVPAFYAPSYAQEPTPIPISPAEMGLQPEDFPEGFEQVTPEDLGMDETALTEGEYEIEGFFAYANPAPELFEVVIGFTMPPEGKLQEIGVEALFENPQPLFDQVLGSIEELEAAKAEEQPMLELIGDKAKAFKVKATMNGISLGVDLLLFTRGPVVAFLMTMYPEGQKFLVDLGEAGKKFDQRIIAALPPELLATPTPTPKKKLFDVLKETPSPAPTLAPSPTPTTLVITLAPSPTPTTLVITLEPTVRPTPTPLAPTITPLLPPTIVVPVITPKTTLPPTPTPKKPGIVPATPEAVETPPTPAGPIEVSLQPEDFPPGFEQADPEELGITEESLSAEGYKVENLFVYMYPELENFEMVMGFTMALKGKLQQLGVDMVMKNPDLIIDEVVSSMGATMEVTEKQELTGLEGIDDKAAGVSVVADMQGIQFRMDILIFRRGGVLAFAMAMYMEDSIPLISIQEVGEKFDQRILAALGG
ncbi:MAG: hypothetical protein ACUVV0_11670 [Anaerolineae bacterium]